MSSTILCSNLQKITEIFSVDQRTRAKVTTTNTDWNKCLFFRFVKNGTDIMYGWILMAQHKIVNLSVPSSIPTTQGNAESICLGFCDPLALDQPEIPLLILVLCPWWIYFGYTLLTVQLLTVAAVLGAIKVPSKAHSGDIIHWLKRSATKHLNKFI